ncbi:MAG: glycosyltransferase [Planctomycetota bacterium]
MVNTPPNCILVTPVYKDAARLAGFGPGLAEALAKADLPIRWVIADDGSGEVEHHHLESQLEIYRQVFPDVEFFKLNRHRGKGAAVRGAWSKYGGSGIDWLAFVDADGSVSAETTLRLIREAGALGMGHAILGARLNTSNTKVERTALRLLAGGGFAFLARIILGLNVRDVQCGVKVVSQSDYVAIGPSLNEDGLAFDAELLYALKRLGTRLVASPIDWAEKSGGQVGPLKSALPMLFSLLRVKAKSVAGRYAQKKA